MTFYPIKGKLHKCKYGFELETDVTFKFSHVVDDGHVEIYYSEANYSNRTEKINRTGFMSLNIMSDIELV